MNGFAVSLFVLALFVSSCSLTTTRPVQEMSNADAALKAAKDLHADTLSPELFRSATESYFKAKKEYRLKNFDIALKFANRATRLAEKAEYEAYLRGGATPEISARQVPSEGASSDPEIAMKEARSEGMRVEQAEEMAAKRAEKDAIRARRAREPVITPEEKGEAEPKLDEKKTETKTDTGSGSGSTYESSMGDKQ